MSQPVNFPIFISSPSDVIAERTKAEEVINRLSEEFAGRIQLEPIFWEYEPMRLTATFQTQIPLPSATDLFIGILWSRMGTPLPPDITRSDGSRYNSGTEYELEDAWQSYQTRQKPDILIYRKTAPPPFLLDPDAPDYLEKLKQRDALEQFCRKWFQNDSGAYIGAFNPFETLAQFEHRLEKHLRKLLVQHFPELTTATDKRRQWRGDSPFRGLQVFQPQHAPIFFGRTRAVGEILASLRIQAAHKRPFILVFGMSGSGKSSLLRAGVMPLLTQPGVIEGISLWRIALFTPSDYGMDALSNLALALLSGESLPRLAIGDVPLLAEMIRNRAYPDIQAFVKTRLNSLSEQLGLPLSQLRLLVVVDQMEELFTQEETNHEDRIIFVDTLNALISSGYVWVMGSFRSDFYPRCAELPTLVELMGGKGHYLLTPPLPSEIEQMIRLPANYAGLSYEHHPDTQVPLDETLLDAMVKNPQSLALLEFTLEALYQRRDERGTLTYAAYEAMGGIEGALAQRAEQVFNDLSPAAQAAFPRLMRTLVTVNINDASPITGRRILINDDLLQEAPVAELFNAFIKARLLLTDQLQEGLAYARIAHEALIEHWPRLQSWLREDRQLLRIRARINDAAHYWKTEGKLPELLLPEGKPLLDAEYLRNEGSDAILPEVLEYIELSIDNVRHRQQVKMRHAQQRLRRTRGLAMLMSILALFAVIGGGIGYFGAWVAYTQAQFAEQQAQAAADAYQMAADERNRAEATAAEVLRTQSLFLADLSRQQTQQGNAVNGMLLALEALPQDLSEPERPLVRTAAVALANALNNNHERHVLSGHQDWVSHAHYSADGQHIFTASKDQTARIWSAATGMRVAVLRGHTGWVNDVRGSPDGQWLVTISDDNTARLWRADTYALHAQLLGHSDELWYTEFSPDSRLLVTASKDTTARVWDVASGKLLHVLHGHKAWVNHAVFSPDGRYIATASGSSMVSIDKTARLWSVATGQQLKVFSGHQAKVWRVQFSPDGQQLVTATGSFVEESPKIARLWDIATGDLIAELSGHNDFVFAVSFSPDGKHLLTASFDKTARIWEARTGAFQYELWGHEDKLRAAKFSPDGQYVATASYDRTARLWHTATGKLLAVFAGHTDKLNDVNFSPDSQQVTTAAFDGTARVWNVNDNHNVSVLTGHTDAALITTFTPDNQQVMSAAADGQVIFWDLATASIRQRFTHEGSLSHAALSPDGTHVVTADAQGRARLWNRYQGRGLAALTGHRQAITSTAFAADGSHIVTTSTDRTARLWNRQGELQQVLQGHLETVRHAAFSPSGELVATVAGNFLDNIPSPDNTARLWSVANGTLLTVLSGHKKSVNHVAFSPDGRWLATGSHDDTARLWDVATGELRHVLAGHRFWIYHVAFSPDGQYLVTASRDKTARLWAVTSGQLLQTFVGHRDDVWQATFSADGQLVLTAASDDTARVWDVATGQPLDVLRGHVGTVQQAWLRHDGAYIATASADHTVRLWQLQPFADLRDLSMVLSYARDNLPRQLTPRQRRAFFLE